MQSEGTFTYPDPEEANKTLRSPYPVLSDEQPTLYSGPRMKGRWSPLREGMKSSKEALDPKTGSKRSADFMSFGEKMSQDASFGRILMSQYITQIKEPRLAADVHGCGEDSKGRETTPDSPVSQYIQGVQPASVQSQVGNGVIGAGNSNDTSLAAYAPPAPTMPPPAPLTAATQASARIWNRAAAVQRIQGRGGGKGTKGKQKDTAPANMIPPACVLTAAEALIFWPESSQRHEFLERLLRNGAQQSMIAGIRNYGRNHVHLGLQAISSNTIHYQITKVVKDVADRTGAGVAAYVGVPRQQRLVLVSNLGPDNNMGTSHWAGFDGDKDLNVWDARLIDLAGGVVNWPTGFMKGPFTQCIELAVNTSDAGLLVSDVPRLITQNNFVLPPCPGSGNYDVATFQHYRTLFAATGWKY